LRTRGLPGAVAGAGFYGCRFCGTRNRFQRITRLRTNVLRFTASVSPFSAVGVPAPARTVSAGTDACREHCAALLLPPGACTVTCRTSFCRGTPLPAPSCCAPALPCRYLPGCLGVSGWVPATSCWVGLLPGCLPPGLRWVALACQVGGCLRHGSWVLTFVPFWNGCA